MVKSTPIKTDSAVTMSGLDSFLRNRVRVYDSAIHVCRLPCVSKTHCARLVGAPLMSSKALRKSGFFTSSAVLGSLLSLSMTSGALKGFLDSTFQTAREHNYHHRYSNPHYYTVANTITRTLVMVILTHNFSVSLN